MNGIKMDATTAYYNIDNCFFYPDKWDDESKAAYETFLSRLPADDRRRTEPRPWAVQS